MLRGNDSLMRILISFQEKLPGEFHSLLSQYKPETRHLTERAQAFIYEATYYLRAIQSGAQHRFSNIRMSREKVQSSSLFFLYLTLENFLLNSSVPESKPEYKQIVKVLEEQLKEKVLYSFFHLIHVMRLNHNNLSNLFANRSQLHPIENSLPPRLSFSSRFRQALMIGHPSVAEEPVISSEVYKDLQNWAQKIIRFRQDRRISGMNYSDLHSSYSARVNAEEADMKIRDFLQAEYQDFQSLYLELHEIINLFGFSIVDPVLANSRLPFMKSLLNLYQEMIATAIFAEQDQYVKVLKKGTKIYVNRASFYWAPPFGFLEEDHENPLSLNQSSGYGSGDPVYALVPLVPHVEKEYSLVSGAIDGTDVGLVQCICCRSLCAPGMIVNRTCLSCSNGAQPTIALLAANTGHYAAPTSDALPLMPNIRCNYCEQLLEAFSYNYEECSCGGKFHLGRCFDNHLRLVVGAPVSLSHDSQ